MTDTRRLPSVAKDRERSARPSGPPSTVILLIADSELLAARIEAMLRGDARWRLVVAGPSASAAFVDDHEPAVVLLAVSAERVSRILEGLQALRRLPPVILLAVELPGAWTARARRAGLRGVLRSDATAEEIKAAIAASVAGLVVLHPDAVSAYPAKASDSSRARGGAALTTREVEILEMMAEGIGNRRIAARLGISRNTVKFHVASILDKLNAATRTEAVTIGIREGRISI